MSCGDGCAAQASLILPSIWICFYSKSPGCIVAPCSKPHLCVCLSWLYVCVPLSLHLSCCQTPGCFAQHPPTALVLWRVHSITSQPLGCESLPVSSSGKSPQPPQFTGHPFTLPVSPPLCSPLLWERRGGGRVLLCTQIVGPPPAPTSACPLVPRSPVLISQARGFPNLHPPARRVSPQPGSPRPVLYRLPGGAVAAGRPMGAGGRGRRGRRI